mmetsp:Transcript_20899/g.50959  ORF Transcript_20899/g.50959 Transcript_20899/m.50959 type:complete len:106 (-) Transcript_20899:716-1033(-)
MCCVCLCGLSWLSVDLLTPSLPADNRRQRSRQQTIHWQPQETTRQTPSKTKVCSSLTPSHLECQETTPMWSSLPVISEQTRPQHLSHTEPPRCHEMKPMAIAACH